MWFPRVLDLLFPVRSDEEVLRTVNLDGFLALLAPQPIAYTDPPTIALFPFRRKEVRAAVHEAKYHESRRAFAYLGQALKDYLADLDTLEERETVLVPLPLGRARMRERGFNQVEHVLKEAGSLPIEHALTRVKETRSQTSLSKAERQENMRGAFAAHGPIDPQTQYVLVDDVITTGATLQAAIDAMRSAGARHLLPIALAHA